MADAIDNLGPRLKDIRLASGKSLREIARQLEVSPSFLSQIENGKSQPSVATLFTLARLLGAPIDSLFGQAGSPGIDAALVAPRMPSEVIERSSFEQPSEAWTPEKARISVVNPHTRSLVGMDSGVRWERLAATQDPRITFMEIVYEPGASSSGGELNFHVGFEYGYALEGEVEITIGDSVLSLSKGQSLGFDSSIPHRFRNISTATFRGIWFDHGCHTV